MIAIRAMRQKKLDFSIDPHKAPSQPAPKFPIKLAASHTPIIVDAMRVGAILDTSDRPIGERYNSPIVMTMK